MTDIQWPMKNNVYDNPMRYLFNEFQKVAIRNL